MLTQYSLQSSAALVVLIISKNESHSLISTHFSPKTGRGQHPLQLLNIADDPPEGGIISTILFSFLQ